MNPQRIEHCDDLTEGDEIAALRNGRVIYRGQVEDRMRAEGIFWIFEAPYGTRKMLEFADFDSIRTGRPPTGLVV